VLGWRGSLGRCRRFSYFAESLFENVCCVGCAGQWDKGLSPRCALKPRHNNNALCTEWKSLIWQVRSRIRTAGLSRKRPITVGAVHLDTF
jgi:hypothetical protein